MSVERHYFDLITDTITTVRSSLDLHNHKVCSEYRKNHSGGNSKIVSISDDPTLLQMKTTIIHNPKVLRKFRYNTNNRNRRYKFISLNKEGRSIEQWHKKYRIAVSDCRIGLQFETV